MSDKKVIILFITAGLFLWFFKNFLSFKYIILGFAGLTGLICAIYWKKSLLFLLYWILIEGAFRKWIFPFMQRELFLVKFLILFSIYTGYLVSKKIKGEDILPSSPLNFLILPYLFMGFAQIFNPKLPSIFIGITGFVVEFSFVPLIFIVKEVFDKEKFLYKFLKIYAYSSLPFMILGIIQYNLPPTHILNYYAHGTPAEAFVGKAVRITSAFPYINGYTTYLNLISVFLLYILTTFDLKLYERIYSYILIVLVFLSLFLTGSRGPFAITLFIYLSYLIISSIQGLYGYKHLLRKWILRLVPALGISALFIFWTPFGKRAYNNFMQRMGEKGEQDIRRRIKITYIEPFKFSKYAGAFGYGAGSAYQGSLQFVENEEVWGDMPRAFEPEPGRLILEYGVLGFLLVFILRWSIIFCVLKKFFTCFNIKLKYFFLIILLYLLPSGFMITQINFMTHRNLFFWFLSGFLFLSHGFKNEVK